ncbi:hypothetical protein TVAGG3_0502320 [Trichomonas vaginalis G3]|uniref:hypothetical protein n=1 Tax=Trichomonas vaginalis (strain ATCC PRA-98 / G3) TaxID=412133 RepID=UPI0021E551E6|nr:hypothetical protein TVAGG3_0502320 [Trichomonas vaginalis G3]KAI5517172.1 hypothetical protein TVAGG3_0502320 [Trichomonas vaginalis G3]
MQDQRSSMTDNSFTKALLKVKHLYPHTLLSMSKEVTQVSVQSDSNRHKLKLKFNQKKLQKSNKHQSNLTTTTEAQVVQSNQIKSDTKHNAKFN